MQQTVEFQIEPLPGSGIWTGSDDHLTMTFLKGTSLIGSMRFWTEALLRAFGNRVCDCVQKHEIFDKTDYMEGGEGKVCAACHSFGCTGLARAFTLHINTDNTKQFSCSKEKFSVPLPEVPKIAYYAFAQGWTDKLSLSLSCRRALSWPCEAHRGKGHYFLPPEVVLATFLMLEYGTLGAMDQYGCGLVRTLNREDLAKTMQEALRAIHKGEVEPAAGYANLRDFYFFKGTLNNTELKRLCNRSISIQSQQYRNVPLYYDPIIRVRRLLRKSIRTKFTNPSIGKELRHWICGFLDQSKSNYYRENPRGSHISIGVSNGCLYGWGWIPRSGILTEQPLNISNWKENRDLSLQIIHDRIKSICPKMVWREYNSDRDKKSPQDWQKYVQDMIANPWRNA